MPHRVLFLNHRKRQCGVYQYGRRVFDIVNGCSDVTYSYEEIDGHDAYRNVMTRGSWDAIVYNYHPLTMPWLNRRTMVRHRNSIGILHECQTNLFAKRISIDPDTTERPGLYAIPRPLLTLIPRDCVGGPGVHEFISYNEGSTTPVFGSFGFGFSNKGFPRLVEMVNSQYDRAIIKLVIPDASFAADPRMADRTCAECHSSNRKSGIRLMVYRGFMEENDLLVFLASNTMNLFLYDKMMGRGISSTVDYALSVGRPLGISDSYMFRHIYHDDICLDKHTIRECMESSPRHCELYRKKYSHDIMIQKFTSIITARQK